MTKLCPKCGAEIIIPGTKPKPKPITVEQIMKMAGMDKRPAHEWWYTMGAFEEFTQQINNHFLGNKEVGPLKGPGPTKNPQRKEVI